MSGGQKLSDQAVIKLEKQIEDGYDKLSQQVKTLQAMLDGLEGHWKGIAAHAFDAKQTEINEKLIHMGKLLARFVEAANKTRHIKTGTEDDIIADMRKINPDLGGKTSALSQY
jgi:WXG100 family type VII secretion target